MKNTSESKKSKLWGTLPSVPYVLWMVAFIAVSYTHLTLPTT